MHSLYGAARIGDFLVNWTSSPAASRWAIILLSAVVLALGGCGRKGGLDLPPNAPQPTAAATGDTADQAAKTPSVFNPTYGSNAPVPTPKGPKRSFVLDPLLSSQ